MASSQTSHPDSGTRETPGAPPSVVADEAAATAAENRLYGSGARTPMPGWFYSFLPNKLGLGATINLPPIFLTEILGGNVASVGLASALTSAATVPAAAVWGWLSDRFGTRKVYLILGYFGFAIPTLLTAFATEVWHYMALALLLGAWSVAGTPVSSTLIMDTVPRADWDETFGKFNAISGWGIVAGRLMGLICIGIGIAWLGNEQTQRGLWLLSGLVALLSVVWALGTVPQPHMPKPHRPRSYEPAPARFSGHMIVERARYLPQALYHLPPLNPRRFFGVTVPRLAQVTARGTSRMLRNPLAAYYLATFVMFTMSVMAYTPFAVWQRQVLGNSSATVFMVGMINSVASALTFRWVGKQIKRYGSMRVQMLTISARVVSFGGFAVIGWMGITGNLSLALLLLLNALSGLGWAGIAVAGNSTVAHLAPRGSEGAAVGTYTSFVSIGSILGALVSGYLVLWLGYEFVFMAGALGVAVTVGLLALIRRSASAEARTHL